MKCKARRYSDQMVCHDCRVVYDVNDTELPKRQCDVEVEDARISVTMANLGAYLSDHAIEFPERHHG